MGRQDVERALRAMDDDKIRERLSQGDFESAGDLNLTDEERTLVRDAAGDYPDLAGFSFEVFQGEAVADIFAKLGDIKGESLAVSGIGDKFQRAWKYTLRR